MSDFRGSFFKEPRKAKPKYRRPMRAVSEKRYSEFEVRAAIRAAVIERDGGCVLALEPGVGTCQGRDTVHHILKEGQGGPFTMENLVCLCWFHNGWVEDNPNEAEARGLVRHWWEATS